MSAGPEDFGEGPQDGMDEDGYPRDDGPPAESGGIPGAEGMRVYGAGDDTDVGFPPPQGLRGQSAGGGYAQESEREDQPPVQRREGTYYETSQDRGDSRRGGGEDDIPRFDDSRFITVPAKKKRRPNPPQHRPAPIATVPDHVDWNVREAIRISKGNRTMALRQGKELALLRQMLANLELGRRPPPSIILPPKPYPQQQLRRPIKPNGKVEDSGARLRWWLQLLAPMASLLALSVVRIARANLEQLPTPPVAPTPPPPTSVPTPPPLIGAGGPRASTVNFLK